MKWSRPVGRPASRQVSLRPISALIGGDSDVHARSSLIQRVLRFPAADASATMIASPCTDEVAVFWAFARVLNEAKRRFVIIDTAPTGHTLLLLDATGSYHREMMRQMGKAHPADEAHPSSDGHTSVKGVTTPMMKLQDPSYTKIIIVTLLENTPVLEASRLQDDLRRAQIEPYAWVINGGLSATPRNDSLLRARAAGERELIEEVRDRHALRTFLTPWQAEPPVGPASLLHLIGSREKTRMSGTMNKPISLVRQVQG